MNMKKYEILMDKEYTIEFEGRTLHRIRALKDFGDVRKGDLGGFVENENNLSQDGNCWIYDNAKAIDYSEMYDNSSIHDNSIMFDNSEMYDNSIMSDNSEMHGNSEMYDNSRMYDNSKMYNNSIMFDNSKMYGNSKMYSNSKMYGYSIMYGYSKMYDYSKMYGNSEMHNASELKGNEKLYGRLHGKVDDFIEINNPDGRLVTCVKKGNEIFYTVSCQKEIDEETFKDRIENKNGGLEKHPYRKEYYKIIEMAKLYFGVK